MARGGKVGCNRNFKKRVCPKDKGSDDSDEDYVISDEENGVSDEDYCSSLDKHASEESFGRFVEEEEEEVRKIVRSKVSSNAQKGIQRKVGAKTARKRRRVTYGEEDEDEDYEVDEEEEEEEEEEDDEEEEEDEEEFTSDEDDCSGEEEESGGRKKTNNTKVRKRGLQRKGSVRGQKGKRKSKILRKAFRKKRRKNSGLRRKVQYDDDDEDGDEFATRRSLVRGKCEKKPGQRKRKYVVRSDSDLLSSDYDYAVSEEEKLSISEEERQQIREAREFCGSLRVSLRSSSVPWRTQEEGDTHQQVKRSVRKGKEKLDEPLGKKRKEVEEVRTEAGKQVCGICLSEEDKRRVRGTLDCCSHYFCFACIMEWAKVESRCPLCKQRFRTIRKPARSTAAVDLREVLIQVPERDQVYQPSEEELRSFLDPYENVICTECHEGGDDGLMLLCDLCDSPAHTYCVGLGREVPEGNWYCDGCRPVALASSGSQARDNLTDERTRSNIFYNRSHQMVNIREGLDLNSTSSPRTPFSPTFGNLSSPRFHVGDSQAASPVSGAGAPTLSGRRRIHRHIQQLISLNRMNSMVGRTEGVSAANSSSDFLNCQNDQDRDRDTTTQQTRTRETGTSYHTFFEDRLQANPSPPFHSRDFFPSRLSFVRRQAALDQATTTTDNRTLWPEPSGMNPIPNYEQLQHSRSSNIGSDGSVSPYAREGIHFNAAKEQLQCVVRSHLKNLARDVDIGNNTFKDIARISTHTILAACGLEHRRSEVHYPVPPPSVCSHIELMAGGQTSLMRGCCSSCFDSFVGEVVKTVMDTRLPTWLSLGL